MKFKEYLNVTDHAWEESQETWKVSEFIYHLFSSRKQSEDAPPK